MTATRVLPEHVGLPARVLMSALVLLSGFGTFAAVAATQAHRAASDAPRRIIPLFDPKS
jgi:hypothetical protein